MSDILGSIDKTVFVLGAGFSRAFVETAPLMEGFLRPHTDLLKPNHPGKPGYKPRDPDPFRPVREFIERCGMVPESLNIETLLTLASLQRHWMSIDDSLSGSLTAERTKRLISTVIQCSFPTVSVGDGRWKITVKEEDALRRFARHLLFNTTAHVITFNYDPLLENFLELEKEKYAPIDLHRFDVRYSYGFRGVHYLSRNWVDDAAVRPPDAPLFFLKLHGSTQWVPRRLHGQPAFPDDILITSCHQDSERGFGYHDVFFEPNATFIIPPVLDKSSMLSHPVVSAIWARAAELLATADQIVFLGYSFPSTDYYAEFLFRYHAEKSAQITVVNWVDPRWPRDKQASLKEMILNRFKSILPQIQDDHFSFGGAAEYCGRMVDPAPASPPSI